MVISAEIQHTRAGVSNDVWLVTLTRPRKANAYTTSMIMQLHDLITEARQDPSIRAAVLTGAGTSFCAGADFDELGSRVEEDGIALASREVFDLWATAPWPTVAAVNGPAIGGGFELALACDVRVCSPRARFALPEVGRGLLPAAGGIRRLVAELGLARAKEVVLFGKKLDADTAVSWGIAAETTDDVLGRAVQLAGEGRAPDALVPQVAKMLFEECASTLDGRRLEALGQALFYGRRHRTGGAS